MGRTPTKGRPPGGIRSSPPGAPAAVTPRRSLRLLSPPSLTPSKRPPAGISPATPNLPESKRRSQHQLLSRRRVHYKKVVYDGGEFEVGDDVYVKRREDEYGSDLEEPEAEECRICFLVGSDIMVECDDCLGGFHLRCLRPPLPAVPDGDWFCPFCTARREGREMAMPAPPDGVKRKLTAKEKLLNSDLWAARIERLWRETNGTYWARCRWYIIPEETAVGRQPHNLRRELYRTNDFGNIEMESVFRHCQVMSPKDFREANDGGDDVFYCEYEYDINWHNFKRITDLDDAESCGDGNEDSGCSSWDSGSDADEDSEVDEDTTLHSDSRRMHRHAIAANSRKGRIYGLQKIGARKIPVHVRCHQQTDLEKAKETLLLSSLPKSLPCRDREMEEIFAFVKDAVSDEHCLGRCLYIHGVPGTGKTMSVLAVMRNLKTQVDAGTLRPYRFIEINGLKLSTPESIYRVIYEQLSGNRIGWKKALHQLNEHFSVGAKFGRQKEQPVILLIDELDLLLTRNQSVLYNILDWPTKPRSRLIVIGISNTMDLPEKLLPRISSRMGIQRLCFGPYNYQQLQEIISCRLRGIDAFEDQAIEFACRKVAAISGDARRALEICRRAAEFADYRLKHRSPSESSMINEKCLVSLTDIEAAIQEVFQAPHIQVMKNWSKFGKVILATLVCELQKTGLCEITFEKLVRTVYSWCHANREPLPGYDTLSRVCCKLGESKLIICEEGTKRRLQKLQLNYPSDDVSFALKDSSDVPWLSKYL